MLNNTSKNVRERLNLKPTCIILKRFKFSSIVQSPENGNLKKSLSNSLTPICRNVFSISTVNAISFSQNFKIIRLGY